ncbi:tail fiber protein [Alloalcanivorax gelatiniphagus]
MSDSPFLAEIALFPYTFAPQGWAWCDGQLLPLSQNTALFALLGTTYGGNGKSTFALPNLNGRTALGHGWADGLSSYALGQAGGTERVTLLTSEIPTHAHGMTSSYADAETANPAAAAPALGELDLYHATASGAAPLAPSGGDASHNNMQPYLTLRYAIALQGVFPPRH